MDMQQAAQAAATAFHAGFSLGLIAGASALFVGLTLLSAWRNRR